MRTALFAAVATAVALGAGQAFALGGTDGPAHAMAMHGQPKYGPDFTHFDYVNPDAPKGGTVVQSSLGTFDTLNPFIIKGTPGAGSASIYNSLTAQSNDEAFTQYCELCETMEVPDDRAWVEFTLREEARWHDGQPVTVDDVIWTFNTLRNEGAPFYRFYYADVVSVAETGPRKVRFTFKDANNPELALIVGQLVVLPKHYWATREFNKTTLEPPLGSGPYRIAAVEPGRSITLERVKDYWGKDIPTERGQNNWDRQRIDYYRDSTVALQAFLGGAFDIRAENVARNWATAYDTPAVNQELIRRWEVPTETTEPMQGFVFNLRKPMFQDRRTRQALSLLFDFEWTNANIFYDAYKRTRSYFENSELSSTAAFDDLPADAGERLILERYRGRVPDEVFGPAYQPPVTDGSGRPDRRLLREARALLADAGWEIKDKVLVDAATGQPFSFEILYSQPESDRIILPFIRNMKRLGVDARPRLVDASQYRERLDNFDFDMTTLLFGQSLSPGNEQRDYWGSDAAGRPGSRNRIGISDPVIDELIELVITAPDRESLEQRSRALDRVLQWGFYLIPQMHVPHIRLAYWDKFGIPETLTIRGTSTATWWIDPAKAERVAEARPKTRR